MSTFQKVIKYLALYFALALVVGIVFVSITAINSIWYIFGNEGSNERNNVATYESATNLKIDLKISKLTIKTGDTLRVESNNENIKYENQFGTLKIVEDKHFEFFKNNEVVLYIPEDIVFENTVIKTGVGNMEIKNLNTKTISLDLGVGKSDISNLITEESTIKGGIGYINISNSDLGNSNLDMGIGALNINAQMKNSTIESGIGAINLYLTDSLDNYTIKGNKGIGSIKVVDKKLSNEESTGNGEYKINAKSGIGAININGK